MNTSNVPGTKEEKLEALRAQALKKGREFNETATKEMLGIVDAPVEPKVEEAKEPSKKAKKAVVKSEPKISKGKVGKK